MKVTMDDSRITSITQLKEFLKGSETIPISLKDTGIQERYQVIQNTLKQFQYHSLRKKDKHIIILYL